MPEHNRATHAGLRALNHLTQTLLAVEVAEKQRADLEHDHSSRTLPAPFQAARRALAAARLRRAERHHLNARAAVLRLEVPTGHAYLTVDATGAAYEAWLFPDYTLDVQGLWGMGERAARQATAEEQAVHTENRWATLHEANAVLVPLGVSLSGTDESCQGALLLDANARYLASVRVYDDGHADVLTPDGPVQLISTQFDLDADAVVMACDVATVARALAGDFRPSDRATLAP